MNGACYFLASGSVGVGYKSDFTSKKKGFTSGNVIVHAGLGM